MDHKIATPEPSRPLDARARKSRAALREAMLRLLESDRFEDLTARQICAEAKVGYATFFRQYPDKETLLSEVVAQEISDLLVQSAGILFSEDSLSSARAMCSFIDRHRALWTTLLTGGAAATVRTELLDQARDLALPAKSAAKDIPKDLAVVFATASVLEILTWWLSSEEPLPTNEVAGIIDRLAIAPVLPEQS